MTCVAVRPAAIVVGMQNRRNAQGITPAAARAVATSTWRGRAWGVDKRLRDMLVAAELATVEWDGRYPLVVLTPAGRAVRKVYRRHGLHRERVGAAVERDQRAPDVADQVAAINAATAAANVFTVISLTS